jgi:hypothetical protein
MSRLGRTDPAVTPMTEAWDLSHSHLRLALVAARNGEGGAARMYSHTAAAYAARARALKPRRADPSPRLQR